MSVDFAALEWLRPKVQWARGMRGVCAQWIADDVAAGREPWAADVERYRKAVADVAELELLIRETQRELDAGPRLAVIRGRAA